jgi:aspartokinase-like uncharacterized kinase
MEAVIKVGGSLVENPARLRALCKRLGEIAKRYHVTAVPGGGKFADVVRELDQHFALSSDISHRMAILGMDQFGLLLTQLIPNSCATYLLNDTKQLSDIGVVPIFLPSRLMFHEKPLEPSWDVTSDSIAVYVARRLNADKVILVTDVDGIFTSDPKKYSDAKLLKSVSASELLGLAQRTSVDPFLPELLLKTHMNCYVVNGAYPERIKSVLAGRQTTCTFVAAK